MVHQDGTPEEEQARRLGGLDWFHKNSREEDMWTQITKVSVERDKGYRIHEHCLRFCCVVKSGDLVNTDDNRGVVIVQDKNYLLQCFKNMVVALEEHVPGNKFTYKSVPMHLWSASEILYLIYHFNEKQVVRTKFLKSGPVNASISNKLITEEGWKVFQSYIRLISQIKCFCGDELSTTKLLDGDSQIRLVSFDALVKYLDEKCQLAEVGSGYRSPRDFTFIKNDDELNLFIKWCAEYSKDIYFKWLKNWGKPKSAAVSKKRCQQEAYCSKKRCKTTKEMTNE